MPARLLTAPPEDAQLLPREAARLINVSPKTLANWRASGTGPRYTKLSPGRGGRIRYPLSAVTDWLAERNAFREAV
ncbi:helix-turn-helix domain-containing protein [Streptomyces sp. NPDC093260]|uniref:helix-turn-helix transcriptional regulator n=1 Tax=Streptomyces sp. NPDC093260 TaxID=3155073 RepID=UPI00343E739B